MSLPAEIASFSIMISSVIIFLIRVLDKRLSLSLHSISYRYFSMDTVMSRISSFEITALPNGRIARAINFIGLSSAATRLELIFPHLRHRWTVVWFFALLFCRHCPSAVQASICVCIFFSFHGCISPFRFWHNKKG